MSNLLLKSHFCTVADQALRRPRPYNGWRTSLVVRCRPKNRLERPLRCSFAFSRSFCPLLWPVPCSRGPPERFRTFRWPISPQLTSAVSGAAGESTGAGELLPDRHSRRLRSSAGTPLWIGCRQNYPIMLRSRLELLRKWVLLSVGQTASCRKGSWEVSGRSRPE